ncbi:hypothetical protein ACI393_27350, partial [Klebsiella pneumoniae]
SDTYSVGAILFECLTGSTPERAGARASALCPALGDAHDDVLGRLLARSPDDRFASVDDAYAAIAALEWPDTAASAPPRRRVSARPVAMTRF